MSTKTIAGTPNDPNQDLAIQTDQDCTLDDAMRAVHVTSAGTTVKLPPNPKVDQTHRIVATGGAVTVDGNGHAIVGGGGTVPNASTIEYTFSVANEWVPETGAGEIPVTRMIIAGPGLLGGGSLVADVTLSADLATLTPANVTKSPAVIGTSTQEARADHKHDVSTAVPVAVGLVNAEGVATTLSRSDHVHAAGATSGGTTLKFSGFAEPGIQTYLCDGGVNPAVASAFTLPLAYPFDAPGQIFSRISVNLQTAIFTGTTLTVDLLKGVAVIATVTFNGTGGGLTGVQTTNFAPSTWGAGNTLDVRTSNSGALPAHTAITATIG